MNNKDKKYTFVFFRAGLSGGTGTFAIRLSKILLQNGHKVFYLFTELNDSDNQKTLENNGVVLIHSAKVNEVIGRNDRLVIITYSIEEYCEAVFAFRKKPKKIVFLYPIMNGITGDIQTPFPVVNKLNKWLAKSFFLRLYKNRRILFSMKSAHQKYIDFYSLPDIPQDYYFPIPIESGELTESDMLQRYNEKPRRIITVLRAEFPLRGYVFGLIEDMKRLWNEGINVELTIISKGEKNQAIIDALGAWVNTGFVHIVNGCSYDSLSMYLGKSFINIGHGTSILDAARIGLPSLVAADMSYSNLNGGFFSECNTITVHEKDASFTFYDKIHSVVESISFDEYSSISKNEYQMIEQHYSTQLFYSKLCSVVDHSVYLGKKDISLCFFLRTRLFSIISTLRRGRVND